jgi:hypothetical protein
VDVVFVGELTGARFRWDGNRPLTVAGWGTRYQGTVIETGKGPVEVGQTVLVHEIDTLVESFQDDLDRARHAIDVARRPAVAECPTIVRFIDFSETTIPADEFNPRVWETLRSAWEFGDLLLRDAIPRTASEHRARFAADVAAGITSALACLHGDGLVHCDLAPNDIVSVAGVWKLIDLDHCVEEGGKVTGLARPPYALPGARVCDPARREMDEHGLDVILAEIRGRAGGRRRGLARDALATAARRRVAVRPHEDAA